MRFTLMTVVAVATVLGQQSDAAKEDLKKMQGQWTVKSIIIGGKDAMVGDKATSTWTIKDNRVTYGEPNTSRDDLRLDATKSPKTVDVTNVSEKDKKEEVRSYKGIYRIEGDTMIFCMDVDGKVYPPSFESPPGSEFRLITITRATK